MRIQKPSLNIPGCFLAGGAVLSLVTKTPINDYDVYPKNEEGLIRAIEEFMDRGFCANISDKAVTFVLNNELDSEGRRRMGQIILGYYPTAESIFKNFDFTVCMGAYDFDTLEYVFGEDFLTDIASKTLRYNVNTLYPLASFVRTRKYTSKGYKVSKAELMKMAINVASKDAPDSWDELESAIGGVYGKQLCLSKDENGKDIPYSFEAAIERLSNTDETVLDLNTMHVSEEYSSLSLEELVGLLVTKESIKVFSFNDYLHHIVHIDDRDGLMNVGPQIKSNIIEIYKKRSMNIEYYNGPIFGYKVLSSEAGSDILYPGLKGKMNGVTYGVGKTTSYEKSPYLYVFQDYKVARSNCVGNNKKIYRVMHDTKDIKTIANNAQYQVSQMKVLYEVNELTDSQIDDIL